MEKRQFFELTTKTKSSEFLPGKSEIFPENRKFFRKIGNFFDWNRKLLRSDSRSSRLRTRL